MGSQQFGIDLEACNRIAQQIGELRTLGVDVGIVVGGGNIFRGVKIHKAGMERISADHIGMLATVINAIALQQAIKQAGIESRILSALGPSPLTEAYSPDGAFRALDQGQVLLFAGGTGNPYFTTDSAAALRALEIKAQILLKATKVNGIYNKDPVKYSDAIKFDQITYSEVLAKQLGVMDAAAIALCRENALPIRVFDVFADRSLIRAVCNEPVGTLVEEKEL